MADAVVQLSETTRLRYQFTVSGVPSAVPTVTATETDPDGTINNLSNPTLQNSGTDPSYILDYSNASAGDYYIKFLTDDTDCDQYPGVAFYVTVGQVWIEHLDADVSSAGGGASAADIADAVLDEALSGHVSAGTAGYALSRIDDIESGVIGLGASATIVSPVREVGGEYEIDIVQGQTYSIANGNSIDFALTGLPDTTSGSCLLTFTSTDGKTLTTITGNPYTGTLGSWSAGAVTARFELTAAQTATFPVSRDNRTDLSRQIRFELKITLASSAGVVIPVALKYGDVNVLTGAWTP